MGRCKGEIYETGFKTGGRRNFVLELLLDETICEGDILIPKELILLAGGRNDRLPAKKSMSFYFGLHRERHLI